MKQNCSSIVIFKREIKAYFTSPIAYIVTGLFLLASGFLFFNTFFLNNRAELRQFFGLLPIVLSFFIPALTMRLLAEEKRSGSYETLLTLPVTEVEIVLGKYFAAFVAGATMLLPTLFYAITCFIFGKPDAGPMIGGYLGALFLIASFSAIGLFASSLTKNQIIAFFIAFAICIVITLISSFLIFMPASVVTFFNFFSAESHFESISRGIIDLRDLVYFISLTALFFVLTVESLKSTGEAR
ncbi:MAG: ABC-2 transporter permease [Treponema sp.]|jgi:ABC-2 type transport system permease protein|uniref:ABC-2 transporter permease n=1 Tax=Treponema sp. TaxID=166 RepID=UPI002A91BF55|nr:ABC-2 transporter permease [Treponema sp.]MDY6397035.1 ABC-2 transporter permease [Treponema sp.]